MSQSLLIQRSYSYSRRNLHFLSWNKCLSQSLLIQRSYSYKMLMLNLVEPASQSLLIQRSYSYERQKALCGNGILGRNPFLFRGPIPTASPYNSFIFNIIQSALARFFISHQVNEETFLKRFLFCHIKALDKAHFSIILNNPIFTQAKRGPFSDVENFSRF